MPIRPKPASVVSAPTPQTVKPVLDATLTPKVAPQVAVASVSSFELAPLREIGTRKIASGTDDSIGRKKGTDDSIGRKKGTDDSIGRKKGTDDSIGRKKGTDDSIGRTKGTDDSIGRNKGTDDSIGRNKGTDDSIGDIDVRDNLVGVSDNMALHEALNQRMETPTYAYDVSGGIAAVGALAAKAVAQAASSMGAVGKDLANISKSLNAEGLKLLGALVEKSPKALLNRDSQGQSLLANLANLATKPLSSDVNSATTKAELMNGILRDLVNPNQIAQGDAPTCTVTSLQFEFVAGQPSEYVRLLSDLATSGKAKMVGGGSLRNDATDASVRDGRSVSQSLFQSAAMEYGNGRFAEFDPAAKKSVDSKTGETRSGLKPEQQVKVLEQLIGVKYSVDILKTEKEGAKALETLRGFNATSSQNRPILMHLDQGDFNHAVTLHKVQDGQVFFRDPYGTMRSFDERLFSKLVMSVERPTV